MSELITLGLAAISDPRSLNLMAILDPRTLVLEAKPYTIVLDLTSMQNLLCLGQVATTFRIKNEKDKNAKKFYFNFFCFAY